MEWGEPVKGFEDQGSDWFKRKRETTELIYNFLDIVKARIYGNYLYSRKERIDINQQNCIFEVMLVLIEIKDVGINWEWRCNEKCLDKSFHSEEQWERTHLTNLKEVTGKHPQDLAIPQMAEHGERPKWKTTMNYISDKQDDVTVMNQKNVDS